MTDSMKCPFCGQELRNCCAGVIYTCSKPDSCPHEQCYGSKEFWQELIRTRKALDIAWDGLKKIGSGNIIEHSVVGHENDNKIFMANKTLDESKTALEQKD